MIQSYILQIFNQTGKMTNMLMYVSQNESRSGRNEINLLKQEGKM